MVLAPWVRGGGGRVALTAMARSLGGVYFRSAHLNYNRVHLPIPVAHPSKVIRTPPPTHTKSMETGFYGRVSSFFNQCFPFDSNDMWDHQINPSFDR